MSAATDPGQFVVTRGSRFLAELYLDLKTDFELCMVERPERAYRFKTSHEAESMASFLAAKLREDFDSHFLPDMFPEGVPA